MASKATLNTFGAIAAAEGLGRMLLDHYKTRARGETARRLMRSVIAAADDVNGAYLTGITSKELKLFTESFLNAESQMLGKDGSADVVAQTSWVLGLLNDLIPHIKNPSRLFKFERLRDAVWRLHKYYDRNLSKPDRYAQAETALKVWYRGILE